MKFEKAILENPFIENNEPAATSNNKAVISGSNDLYGASSIEDFPPGISDLGLTHEDAKGFLDYPTSFSNRAANYWMRDAGVQVWQYEETYDNWQDTYGMDAVRVFYHSGHGNMDNNGIFQAPVGSKWDNRDWAFSNNMAFGNEELRYLFWSTCYSLRISGGHSPIRTWWGPNKGGLRMLFGYETTSVDDGSYGEKFWTGWKQGKSFARAFLDASWLISHSQTPVVMAVGQNQNDAINRLNNERFFYAERIPKGWYQWQWYSAKTAPTNRVIPPQELGILMLGQKFSDSKIIAKIADQIGIPQQNASKVIIDAKGNHSMASPEVHININREGALNVYFGKANIENTKLLDEQKAIQIAQKYISDLELDKNISLTQSTTRYKYTCGGSNKGSGNISDTHTIETIIQFRQTHNGTPSVNSEHGLIAVSIDNDGRIINLFDSTKPILGEIKHQPAPKDPKAGSNLSMDDQFQRKINKHTRSANSGAKVLREAIGYDFSGNLGTVVHQKDVEIDLGNGFEKRYKVRVPLA